MIQKNDRVEVIKSSADRFALGSSFIGRRGVVLEVDKRGDYLVKLDRSIVEQVRFYPREVRRLGLLELIAEAARD